ncbi:MAG: hypothetical protein WKG32_15450 [Gemmatimonadaceae bacterium]
MTPVGALPPLPMLSPSREGRTGNGFSARYGRYSFEDADGAVNNFGIGGDFPMGAGGRLGLTFGLMLPPCADDSDCGNVIMVGGDATVPLLRSTLGAERGSSAVSIGLNPAVGFGKPTGGGSDGYVLSGALSLPVALSFGAATGPQFVPFLSPGIGLGRVSAGGECESECSETGMRFMFGGGVAVENLTPGMTLGFGFRKIFLEDAPTQFGITLGWRALR